MTNTKQRYLFFWGALILLAVFLWQSATLTEAARKSLIFSANTILPSLFPFLVLAGLLTEASRGVRLPGRRAFRHLFHLPEEGMLAFFLGALCGFPIGVKVTVDLYRAGLLSREEAARLAALSANTGPGFVIAGIGNTLFGNPRIGLLLYGVQLIGAVVLGLLSAKAAPLPAARQASTLPSAPTCFSDVLYRASLSLLGITGITVFFGMLAALPARLFSSTAAACFTALLEVGNGANAASALPLRLGLPLAAFAVSFSGISVLTQSASLLSPEGIPIAPMIRRKLLQGGLAVLLTLAVGGFIFKI